MGHSVNMAGLSPCSFKTSDADAPEKHGAIKCMHIPFYSAIKCMHIPFYSAIKCK